ncbi:MAG TPA: hypothetical protein VI197_24360 [Polyangiaceae bacterium]
MRNARGYDGKDVRSSFTAVVLPHKEPAPAPNAQRFGLTRLLAELRLHDVTPHREVAN